MAASTLRYNYLYVSLNCEKLVLSVNEFILFLPEYLLNILSTLVPNIMISTLYHNS